MRPLVPAWVDGVLTPVDKLTVHVEGLRHKAVSVFILAGDKMLIQRRAMGKYHSPGLWANTCCTHPLWGETAEDCAYRRLTEELGITGLPLEHRGQIEYRAEVGGGMTEHEVVDIFVAQATEALLLRLDPDEVLEVVWIDVGSLTQETMRRPERFTTWLRIYLDEHAGAIFGASNDAARSGQSSG